jgi:hypothetical protein
MGTAKVVDFGLTRELLSQIETVRTMVLAGEIQGWIGTVLKTDGVEIPYAAGVFASDKDAMMKAALRHSVARMKAEDPPLKAG